MKCPVCAASGLKSTIRMAGHGVRTSMFTHRFYDDDGRHHFHDPNQTAWGARCSNGHRLTHIRSNRCGVDGCNFGMDEEIRVMEASEPPKEDK